MAKLCTYAVKHAGGSGSIICGGLANAQKEIFVVVNHFELQFQSEGVKTQVSVGRVMSHEKVVDAVIQKLASSKRQHFKPNLTQLQPPE